MSVPVPTEAVVIAATTIRVPLPGNPPDTVIALVDTGEGRRLVALSVPPDQKPKPNEVIDLGWEGERG